MISNYVLFFQIQCPYFNIILSYFTFYITFQCPICKCPIIIVLVMPVKSYFFFQYHIIVTINAPSIQLYFQLSLFYVMPDYIILLCPIIIYFLFSVHNAPYFGPTFLCQYISMPFIWGIPYCS